MQKELEKHLEEIYKPKVCAYGFIKNRNIVDNAKKHTRKKIVLNIDLKNFFTQIHYGRVRGALLSKPYNISEEAATAISQLVCYNGFLPQGAPTSPVISNIICRSLDTQLIRLSKKYGMTYTRYVDDISFSTNQNSFPKSIIQGEVGCLEIGEELKKIFERNSFEVNERKIFLNACNTRQEVTGLVVNKFPNVKRQYIKNLRALLHNCKRDGIYEVALSYIEKGFCKNSKIIKKSKDIKYKEDIINWFKYVLKGKITFIKQVKGFESYTFLNFAKQLNALYLEEVINISIPSDFHERIEQSVFVLECDKNDDYDQGSGFLLKDYGILTSYHVTEGDDIFKVYKHTEYNRKETAVISNGFEWIDIKSNKDIDYALYLNPKLDYSNAFEIGDSSVLKQGDIIKTIAYPDYQKGATPNIEESQITSIVPKYLGSSLYTIGGKLVHGASGGLVLNKDNEVVGLIKAGVVSFSKSDESIMQGFVPINIVLEHLESKCLV